MTYPVLLLRLLARSGIARYLPSVRRLLEGGTAYLHYYSDRILAAPLEEVQQLAEACQPHGPDVVDLGLGSPRFDLAPSGSTKLPADRRGWPPAAGLPELRNAVAEHLLGEYRLAVSPVDEVLITAGAAGAFAAAMDTLVNPHDRVVLLDPTSPLFTLGLRARRASVRWVDTWVENGRTRFRLDQLAGALRGARLAVICSPGNPTGGVIAPEDLEQLAWWAERHDVLLYSDETFARYFYEGEWVSLGSLPRARKRTLTAGSLSKGHALASARVGWLAGPAHLVRPCLLSSVLHTPFVPTLCQQVAVAALRQGQDAFAPLLAEFAARRRYVHERLEGAGLKAPWPAGAFFFWVPVWELGRSGREFAARLLQNHRTAVTPGELFGPSGKGYVRLSYATEDGRLREGLGRLAEFLEAQEGVCDAAVNAAA